jgi:UDP-glucose 4-epimerase|tara:strand:- start:1996 stop:2865 length:870 start_codon:yes stop_codon:yes gene_type:complete
MKILVVGGSGFVGSHVADALSNSGYSVTIFDNKKSKWLKKNQKMFVGNINNKSQVFRALRQKDYVFNFAAISDIDYAAKNPLQTIQVNIAGTVNILEGCKKYKIKRFVQASSIYVNSVEGGYYKCSKKAAEDYIEEFEKRNHINYTILRFGSLYGPRADKNNGIYKIISSAVSKKKITYYGSNRATRNYIHVEDAAYVCARILKKNFINKHIILMGPKKIQLKEFLKQLSKKLRIKKVLFLNKKQTGHYINAPDTFKPRVGIRYNKIKHKNFLNEVIYLTNQLRKNKKI